MAQDAVCIHVTSSTMVVYDSVKLMTDCCTLKQFCSAFLFQLQNLKQNTYQNNHLKQKSKFLCIQYLVLEVKGLKKTVITLKIDSFISVMSMLIISKQVLILKKKVFKKVVSYIPTLIFQGVTWSTHIFHLALQVPVRGVCSIERFN